MPARAAKKPVKSSSSKKSKKTVEDVSRDMLFPANKRNYRVGGDIRYAKDLSRFVRWPKYIRIQRQKKILQQRLKVPPSLNQFKNTLNKNEAADLFRLLDNYQPETKADKKERIKAMAVDKAEGKDVKKTDAKPVIKFGINHVVDLIETKKAKLVVIAADVDPIELVVYLPALCKMQGVPFMIVKSKAQLGRLVHLKNATAVCLTKVEREHEHKLASLCDLAQSKFNDNKDVLKKWGGGQMGLKTTRRLEIRAKQLAIDEAKKALY
jgi:large subunit ribosomal protein L7Ae